MTYLHIVLHDPDILLPIWPGMLMVEPKCVQQLMGDSAFPGQGVRRRSWVMTPLMIIMMVTKLRSINLPKQDGNWRLMTCLPPCIPTADQQPPGLNWCRQG